MMLFPGNLVTTLIDVFEELVKYINYTVIVDVIFGVLNIVLGIRVR